MAFQNLQELARRVEGEDYGLFVAQVEEPLVNKVVDPSECFADLVDFLENCLWFQVDDRALCERRAYAKELVYLVNVRILDPELVDILGFDEFMVYLGQDQNSLKEFISLGWRINQDLIRKKLFCGNTWIDQRVVFVPSLNLLQNDAVRLTLILEQLRIIC